MNITIVTFTTHKLGELKTKVFIKEESFEEIHFELNKRYGKNYEAVSIICASDAEQISLNQLNIYKN